MSTSLMLHGSAGYVLYAREGSIIALLRSLIS